MIRSVPRILVTLALVFATTPKPAATQQERVGCYQNGLSAGPAVGANETVLATIGGGIAMLPSVSEDHGGCVPAAMVRGIFYLVAQHLAPGDSGIGDAQDLYDAMVRALTAHDRVDYDPKTGASDTIFGWSGSRPNWLEAKERVVNSLRTSGKMKIGISSTQARPRPGNWGTLVNTIVTEMNSGAAVELHVRGHLSLIWRVTRSISNPNVYNMYIADDRSGPTGGGQGDGERDTSSRGPIEIDVAAETCTIGGTPCEFLGIIIERAN